MDSKWSQTHFFTVFTILSAWADVAWSQRSCAAIGPPRAVIEQAVSINTDVLWNTTFYPLPQVALTLTNAPTSINTLTTLRWTTTVPDSTSLTMLSEDVLGSSMPSQFVLMSRHNSDNQKRQSGYSYVGSDGTLTEDCASAVQYSINNGRLIANTSDGTVYFFSTSPNVAYVPFIPTTIPGSISTTFGITAAYDLLWSNAAFFNGYASFCSLQNGTVFAVFQEGVQPDGCFYAPLSPAYGPGCALIGDSGSKIVTQDKSPTASNL